MRRPNPHNITYFYSCFTEAESETLGDEGYTTGKLQSKDSNSGSLS